MERDILYPIRKLHGWLFEARQARNTAKNLKAKLIQTEKNTAFFVLSPTHGNMGDHAIAEAVLKMLRELGVNYLEITTAQLLLLHRFGYLGALDEHLVLVNGGGNLGTLWPQVEKLFRRIIQKNPNASIICLPNTVYYEDSENGRRELERSKKIYNAHPRLKLYARERISYDFMKQIYRDVDLVPDMAFSLDHCIEEKRRGCMLCLRTDREKIMTSTVEKKIVEQAEKLFGEHISWSDMYIGIGVPLEERMSVLERKYNEFSSVELVITDRLHGMIFATITGTPCIVVDSMSPKVRGCFEWIKDLDYIQFADDPQQISAIYHSIPQKKYMYDGTKLSFLYDSLKMYILKEMGEIQNASNNRHRPCL